MNVYPVLANLDFSKKLFEAKAQTALGNEIINKYRTHLVANPVTCGVVNNFLREAQNLSYDSGIRSLVEDIAGILESNKFGWALSSVCESIESGNGRGDYLRLRAVEQVRPMLEMKEDEIVSYIKSGALKNVMYVEQFRNIARAIYKEQPIVEYSDQFTAVHPISVFEKKDDGIYFHTSGHIYRTSENGIFEADRKDVSSDFLVVAGMLENQVVKFKDDALVMEMNGRTYKVEDKDNNTVCSIMQEGKETVYSVDQLRENNNYVIAATPMNLKASRSAMLEGFAKVVENFDNIAIMNNVSVISNHNDRFVVIENNGNGFAKLIQTNHSQPWEVKGDIAKVVESVKKYTHLDVTKLYEQAIEGAIDAASAAEAQQVKENLANQAIEDRKRKIAELTERYKNDPVRLEMLSRVAADLASIQ